MVPKPLLREKNIGQALEAMRTGRSLSEHLLCDFLSVRMRLASPDILPGDSATQLAIYNYLAEVITDRLGRIRHICELPQPDMACSELHLQSDFQQGNDELEAWSFLYHRYVCVDRALSVNHIATLGHTTERSLNRRHNLGITRLTLTLIEQEQQIRRQEVHKRLLLALPSRYSPRLIGTESAFATGLHVLTFADPPHHIVLHGPAGIGKTTLALALARNLVDDNQFDDLLWLNMSGLNIRQLPLEITTRLGVPLRNEIAPSRVLRGYLFAHPTLLILDGAEELISHTERMEQTLSLLDSATVIFTSRIEPPPHVWCYPLPIPELNREQAFEYLEYITAQTPTRNWTKDFEAIWQTVGGNPLALKTVLSASRSFPLSTALSETNMAAIHDQLWQQLTLEARHVWLLPVLCFQDGMSYETIHDLSGLSMQAINHALNVLTSRTLLIPQKEKDTVRYTIQPANLALLIERVRNGLLISEHYSALEFLQEATSQWLPQVSNASQVLYLLGLIHNLGFPPADQWQHTYTVADQIIEAGLWPSWAEQLTKLLDIMPHSRQPWLHLMLGVALRWMGQLDAAKIHLDQALAQCEDPVVEHADILIELSVIYRYKALWEDAHYVAQTALDIYSHANITRGIERCAHELSQLALEKRDPTQTLIWLDRLSDWSARTWGIASQAYLDSGDVEQALDSAQRALAMLPVSHSNRGRAAATLGQIQHKMGHSDAAVATLSSATILLNETKDLIGYARACSNLAVAYFDQAADNRQFQPDEIHNLLMHARHIQEHSGDEIGLAVTCQNLTWLFPSDHNG